MRIGAQAILGTFKSVALPIAEAEASLESVRLRHQVQLARFWINLHTLPKDHPLWKVQKRIKITRRFCSPMARGVAGLNLKPQALKDMEEIHGHCLPPECPKVKVEIEDDRERAVQAFQEVAGIKVAVDCSCRNGLIGVGANYGKEVDRHLTVGFSQKLNVYFGELYAIQWVVEALSRTVGVEFLGPVHVTRLSDSQAALKAIRSPARQGGQWLLKKITWMLID